MNEIKIVEEVFNTIEELIKGVEELVKSGEEGVKSGEEGVKAGEEVIVKSIEDLVLELSETYTKIIPLSEIKNYPKLYLGGNGIGDRWANKKFNYSVVYTNRNPKTYSENDMDEIPSDLLTSFKEVNKGAGIIGIFVFSKRQNIQRRPIRKDIIKEITANSCVVCGSKSDIICDHKNDMYNDNDVLDSSKQCLDDFQALCNHCNLQKRQIFRDEDKNQKIYSAKNIKRYTYIPFEFPWEKKAFDKTDLQCKKDTYWYDPVEFEMKIYQYTIIIIPIIKELKHKITKGKIITIQ